MADWSKPALASTYANFVTETTGRDTDLAVMFDPAVVTPTNFPTNTVRWRAAVNKWEKWNGTVWSDLAATYAINISGNAGTVTNGLYTANIGSSVPSPTGTGASGTWGINVTGSAGSVPWSGVTSRPTRANWTEAGVIANVMGQLVWRNYGNGHTIFDASGSLSPDGTAVNSMNATSQWVASYPTLMGWNGSGTYGVRVDSARIADSTPWATNAGNGGVTSVNGQTGAVTVQGVPAGAVMHFAMATPPTGWLKANGAWVSRSTYASLFAAIGTTFGVGDGSTTFQLPDLRGEFLRGLDDGRGVDPWRVLGSFQASQNLSHAHDYLKSTGTTQRDVGSITCLTPSYSSTATTSEGGNEARPRNIALLACIKF